MSRARDIDATARSLLAEHGKLRSQFPSDWQGTVPLPAELAKFYESVGPVDISIPGYGNGFHVPSLAKLWKLQAGYRWNGLTGEPIPDWDPNWIVVAREGADPFILDCASSKVLFARHGAGSWDPAECFPNLPTMAACLAVLGSVVKAAGDDFTDDDAYVRSAHREHAVTRLAEIVGSRLRAEEIVIDAGWG